MARVGAQPQIKTPYHKKKLVKKKLLWKVFLQHNFNHIPLKNLNLFGIKLFLFRFAKFDLHLSSLLQDYFTILYALRPIQTFKKTCSIIKKKKKDNLVYSTTSFKKY